MTVHDSNGTNKVAQASIGGQGGRKKKLWLLLSYRVRQPIFNYYAYVNKRLSVRKGEGGIIGDGGINSWYCVFVNITFSFQLMFQFSSMTSSAWSEL